MKLKTIMVGLCGLDEGGKNEGVRRELELGMKSSGMKMFDVTFVT